jgi:hypothetical protein
MRIGFRRARLMSCMVFVMLSLRAIPLFAQSGPDSFAGRRLEEVLRLLQSRGVRIVFSSELVTPQMRVTVEPQSNAQMEQLRQLLDPHGLTTENGPGGVIQVVRKKRPAPERMRAAPGPTRATSRAPRDTESSFEPTYREQLTVTASRDGPGEVGAGTARHLATGELRALAGRIEDDPVRLVQALPGVAAADDYRSETRFAAVPTGTQPSSSTVSLRRGSSMPPSDAATRER